MAFGDDATLTAVVNGRKVDLIVQATGLVATTVYRIVSGGNVTVRGAEAAANYGPGLWQGSDHEAPQGVTLQYGALINDGATDFTIAPVTASGGTVDYGGDWLMPVGQPNLGINVTVEAGGFGELRRSIVQDVQPVLNRAAPVVVSYNRRYWTNELGLLTLSDTEREDLIRMLDYPVLMFVARAGFGLPEPVYLAVGDAYEARTSPFGSEPSRRHRLKVTQVDRPPAAYPYTLVGDSWQSLYDAPVLWSEALGDYLNWYDMAGYPS